jgi:kynureninase
MDPRTVYAAPNALAPHYSRFRVSERLLLTGHSHQAWPDAGLAAQSEAWTDAAELVDDKWGKAFEKAARVKAGFTRLLGDPGDGLALGSNTHELVVRLISAIDTTKRPRIVTTDGEFHTIRRQLDRMAEAGVEVVKVPEHPVESVAARLAAAVDGRTGLVLVSYVFFDSGRIARGLGQVAMACAKHGAELLVDVYHALNVVPFDVRAEGLTSAFVVGGGYKYCQLGEGNCFLRVPEACGLRPVITGWYSEFTALAGKHGAGEVVYGQGGERFAGATYDPTSHYRAAAVFDFFAAQRLTAPLLREVSQHQIGVLAASFDSLALDPKVVTRDRSAPLTETAGFLALRSPIAGQLQEKLQARGVLTDSRGEVLRFGPAPYLSDRQLTDAVGILGEVVTR